MAVAATGMRNSVLVRPENLGSRVNRVPRGIQLPGTLCSSTLISNLRSSPFFLSLAGNRFSPGIMLNEFTREKVCLDR